MAMSKENDLIGYDPLAWMSAVTDEGNDLSDTDIVAQTYDDRPGTESDSAEITQEFVSEGIGVSEVDCHQEQDIACNPVPEYDSPIADQSTLEEEFPITAESEELLPSLVTLDSSLTIQSVLDLHGRLKKVLSTHDQIEIDASSVSSIDTTTLQLLVSMKRTSVKLQKNVTIINPSPRFVESAKLLGLLSVLEVESS